MEIKMHVVQQVKIIKFFFSVNCSSSAPALCNLPVPNSLEMRIVSQKESMTPCVPYRTILENILCSTVKDNQRWSYCAHCQGNN